MRFFLAILLGLAAPAFAAPAFAATSPGAKDPLIVIGIAATLSGPGAMAGQDAVDGFNLAMRHLGGRFANQEVRVVVQDDHGSPGLAPSVAVRLAERDKADVVLTATSRASLMVLMKLLINSKVFVFNLEAAPAALAGAECSAWFFQTGTPAPAVHEAAGQHFTAEHVQRLVVIGPETPQTEEAVAALKRTFTGEVVAVLKPRHGAATFQSEIARLSELKPDAVYTVLTGGMQVGFVRAYDAAGLKAQAPLAGPWTGFERPLLQAMAEAALDTVNIAPWNADLDTPQNKRLAVDFELEYGRPATSWAAQGYDTALLLDAALKLTGGRTSDPDLLRSALRRAEVTSVRGGFRFNSNHQPVINLYLRKVGRDAKGRLVNEIRSVVLKEWRDRNAAQCPLQWTNDPIPVPPQKSPPKPGATPAPPRR
jgi:branched-chain amino acid transport system substrate-binding protein